MAAYSTYLLSPGSERQFARPRIRKLPVPGKFTIAARQPRPQAVNRFLSFPSIRAAASFFSARLRMASASLRALSADVLSQRLVVTIKSVDSSCCEKLTYSALLKVLIFVFESLPKRMGTILAPGKYLLTKGSCTYRQCSSRCGMSLRVKSVLQERRVSIFSSSRWKSAPGMLNSCGSGRIISFI